MSQLAVRQFLWSDLRSRSPALASSSVDLGLLSADLDVEAADHVIEAVDRDREAGDSVAVTADRQIVSGDGTRQAAVRGKEAAHKRRMSTVLITFSGDRTTRLGDV
ncbi:MAG TPA: hypothetical protein VGP84_01945 [Gemmatimonadaceae bacterium]|nr:hypothetical protein [Gemmatimonadaceae bacterium]